MTLRRLPGKPGLKARDKPPAVALFLLRLVVSGCYGAAMIDMATDVHRGPVHKCVEPVRERGRRVSVRESFWIAIPRWLVFKDGGFDVNTSDWASAAMTVGPWCRPWGRIRQV
jgi:hypothetical protein